MRVYLSPRDISLVLESLLFTKQKFQAYDYTSALGHKDGYEFRQLQVGHVESVIAKIRNAKRRAKK